MKTCINFMSGDSNKMDNVQKQAELTSNDSNKDENEKKKTSTGSINFSVDAKPFVAKEQNQQTNSNNNKPQATIQPQIPLNIGNLINLQTLQQLNNAAAVINFQQQQQQLARQQQLQIPQVNHPLLNNQQILKNLLPNNVDKNRLVQQLAQQQQQQQQVAHVHTQPQLNMNDLTTVATLSNLASTILACLPSSLQQFYYSKLNNAQNSVAASQVGDLETFFKQQQPQQQPQQQQQQQQQQQLNNKNSQLKAPIKLNGDTKKQGNLLDSKTVDSQTYDSINLRNPNTKYTLEHEWSFWFYKSNRDTEWRDNMIFLTTVSTVEDFWSVFNHLRPASDLHEGCDYMFFKKGIEPMWEDEENRDGGRWLVSLSREQRAQYLDSLWLNTLISLIGSQYDAESALVNGAVVNVRFKFDKLSLWTKHYKLGKEQYAIGGRFKKVLGVTSVIYEIHESNQILLSPQQQHEQQSEQEKQEPEQLKQQQQQ